MLPHERGTIHDLSVVVHETPCCRSPKVPQDVNDISVLKFIETSWRDKVYERNCKQTIIKHFVVWSA